ncbi:unnamed protein product [Penicillium camemberti]|uniref:Str. FM013 n=1 Tax=Penicillium camemberti (strain FM 013) TaxID=1429867 RepID=A0A0G4PGR7_PENC3|nr:unnamed protein product [Penicillium camemberti]
MGEGDGKGKERRCGTSPVRARSDGAGAIEAPNPPNTPEGPLHEPLRSGLMAQTFAFLYVAKSTTRSLPHSMHIGSVFRKYMF